MYVAETVSGYLGLSQASHALADRQTKICMSAWPMNVRKQSDRKRAEEITWADSMGA